MNGDVIRFTISIPTDQGFLGRQCNNPDCKRYFKVYTDSLKSKMFCPYCGLHFANDNLWTTDQENYIQSAIEEKAKEIVHEKLDEIFRDLQHETSNNEFIQITYTPSNYVAQPILPNYSERQMDSELICPICQSRFQVIGIFGYCPGCCNENLLVYDANLEIIKQEVIASQDPQRALRHAYSDLVSAFEGFCKRKAQSFTTETARFQILFEARKFFKDKLGINILAGLHKDDLLALRRVFQKRHSYEHNHGIIEEKYVKMIPEDAQLLNQRAILSLDEFISASHAMRQALDNLVRGIEK
jgi:uncharacterized Zn-finger protein